MRTCTFILAAVVSITATIRAEIKMSTLVAHTGMCDASAAVPLGPDHFVVANDEDNNIRVYRADRAGPPVQGVNLAPFLRLSRKSAELDLEGAVRIDDRVYWITSHGRNEKGRDQPSRRHFFATDIAFPGLEGRGIREIVFFDNRYLIIGGATDGKGKSRFYEWLGGTDRPTHFGKVHFEHMNPEAIVFYPDKGWKRFLVLSDDGGRSVGGKRCKDLKDPSQKVSAASGLSGPKTNRPRRATRPALPCNCCRYQPCRPGSGRRFQSRGSRDAPV